jgi:hypothetical protein
MEAREIWSERVAQWKASGLTAAEFAQRHNVGEASLRWWRWKLGTASKKAVTSMTFVEIPAPVRRAGLELVLDDRVVVRVPPDFDEPVLTRLLDVLERRR